MIATIRQHPVMAAILAALLLIALLGSVTIVPETSQGVVIRFGEAVRIVNRYEPGQRFGGSGAGLNAKLAHGVRQHLAEQSGRLARLQLLLSAAQFLTVMVVFRSLQSAKKNAENAL